MLVPGSSVNLENPGLDTITHPALSGVPVKHCLQGGGNVAFLKQSYCIRNINRASFKGVCLHIESGPTSIRLDGLTKVTLR